MTFFFYLSKSVDAADLSGYIYAMTYEEEMNATARNWNRTNVTTRYILKNIGRHASIVDFGAGKFQSQTRILRNNGHTVYPYDIGGTGRKVNRSFYNSPTILMASNVLNVQPNMDRLYETLKTMDSFSPKMILANYPAQPRKLDLTLDEMNDTLGRMDNYTVTFTRKKDNLIILNRYVVA